MSTKAFNLIDALSQLLSRIEPGRAQMKAAMPLLMAFNETNEKFEAAIKRWQNFIGPDPSEKETVANHESEVEKLRAQRDDQWRSYKSERAFLDPFVADTNLLLERLPLGPEWKNYWTLIGELRFTEPGAWMEPPTNPDLVTLEFRLAEMLNLARSGNSPAVTGRVEPRRLPLPAGTGWSDITIRFLSDQQFQVSVSRHPPLPPTTFEEAGFADRRGNLARKPIAAWATLRELAGNEGSLSRPSMSAQAASHLRPAFEKRIEEIRERFKLLFGLPDDPFHPFADDNYRLIAKISSNE